MHIFTDWKTYEERTKIYEQFYNKWRKIIIKYQIFCWCCFVLFFILYAIFIICKTITAAVLSLIFLITGFILVIIGSIFCKSILSKKNYNLYLDLTQLYGLEDLVEKGNVEANVEIINDDIKNEVIRRNISKVEITKKDNSNLIAKIHLKDGFVLSPVRISSSDFLSLIKNDVKNVAFSELVNYISIEEMDNRYCVYLELNTDDGPKIYEANTKEELAKLIRTKNI